MNQQLLVIQYQNNHEIKKECLCNNPVKSVSTKIPAHTRKLGELHDNEKHNPSSKTHTVTCSL